MVMGRRPEVATAGALGAGKALGKVGFDLARHLAEVPLLVCTADRPPELHGVGAAQTIDQRGLFGPAVRAELERQRALEETDAYLAELDAELGPPAAEEQARAEAIARRIRERSVHRAG